MGRCHPPLQVSPSLAWPGLLRARPRRMLPVLVPHPVLCNGDGMKRSALSLLFPLFLALSAEAAVSPIHMTVEQSNKTEAKKTAPAKSGKRTAATVPGGGTQVRSLAIKLENHSKETFNDLIVKYWFFGHDAKAHDAKPVQAGQRKSALGPNARETVESETVSIPYAPEHLEKAKGRSGRGKSGAGTAKKVPASGTKLTGYAVQVFNGSTIVAEEYSEESYKAKIGTAPPSLADPAAAKPAGKSKKPKRK